MNTDKVSGQPGRTVRGQGGRTTSPLGGCPACLSACNPSGADVQNWRADTMLLALPVPVDIRDCIAHVVLEAARLRADVAQFRIGTLRQLLIAREFAKEPLNALQRLLGRVLAHGPRA